MSDDVPVVVNSGPSINSATLLQKYGALISDLQDAEHDVQALQDRASDEGIQDAQAGFLNISEVLFFCLSYAWPFCPNAYNVNAWLFSCLWYS